MILNKNIFVGTHSECLSEALFDLGFTAFEEYFTYIELIVHQKWAKTENLGKPPDHLYAELGFPTCDPSKARTTVVRNLMD